MKRTTYHFYGPKVETADGIQRTYVASGSFECDAQAEAFVNNLRDEGRIPLDDDGNSIGGLTIMRGTVEWFSRGI